MQGVAPVLGDDTQREFKVGVHPPYVPRADIETVDALANGRPLWRWLPSPTNPYLIMDERCEKAGDSGRLANRLS